MARNCIAEGHVYEACGRCIVDVPYSSVACCQASVIQSQGGLVCDVAPSTKANLPHKRHVLRRLPSWCIWRCVSSGRFGPTKNVGRGMLHACGQCLWALGGGSRLSDCLRRAATWQGAKQGYGSMVVVRHAVHMQSHTPPLGDLAQDAELAMQAGPRCGSRFAVQSDTGVLYVPCCPLDLPTGLRCEGPSVSMQATCFVSATFPAIALQVKCDPMAVRGRTATKHIMGDWPKAPSLSACKSTIVWGCMRCSARHNRHRT